MQPRHRPGCSHSVVHHPNAISAWQPPRLSQPAWAPQSPGDELILLEREAGIRQPGRPRGHNCQPGANCLTHHAAHPAKPARIAARRGDPLFSKILRRTRNFKGLPLLKAFNLLLRKRHDLRSINFADQRHFKDDPHPIQARRCGALPKTKPFKL